MTNRTTDVPRPGAGVRFGIPDTAACSNRTTNRTPSEREPDNEPDTAEPDTLHAHEPDTMPPIIPSMSAGSRSRKAPLAHSSPAAAPSSRPMPTARARRSAPGAPRSPPRPAPRSAPRRRCRVPSGSGSRSGSRGRGRTTCRPMAADRRPCSGWTRPPGTRPSRTPTSSPGPPWTRSRPLSLAMTAKSPGSWCPSDTRIPPRVLASRSRSRPSR